MPTTDAEVALELLHSLEKEGIGFALLHGENALKDPAQRNLNDIDIVADRPAPQLIGEVVAAGASRLVPIFAYEYDSGAWATFWVTPDGRRGVHLDIICDPRGRGRLGVRTDKLLETRQRGSVTWQLPRSTELTYLALKRWSKNDLVALERLRTELGDAQASQSHTSSRKASRRLGRIVNGRRPRRFESQIATWRSRIGLRGYRRLARRASVVLRFTPTMDDSALEGLVGSLSDTLVLCGTEKDPRLRNGRISYEVRLRPWVILSTRNWPKADATIAVPHSENVARTVVDAMSSILLSRLEVSSD